MTEPGTRSMRVRFEVSGPADERAVVRAVALSMDKYCSVARTLEHRARIGCSSALVPAATASGEGPA